jgi:hypothetical protein
MENTMPNFSIPPGINPPAGYEKSLLVNVFDISKEVGNAIGVSVTVKVLLWLATNTHLYWSGSLTNPDQNLMATIEANKGVVWNCIKQ